MAVAFASGTLTVSGNFSNTETVTIGSKVYTFQTVLTNVDGNIKIAASAALSLVNLYNAINLLAGVVGTDYATAMTANADVVPTAVTATTLVVKSKVAGTVGNFVPTTETGAAASFGATTLAGGTGSVSTDIRSILSARQVNAGISQELINIVDPEGDE